MEEPTFDKHGYPTEETLDAIKNWALSGNYDIDSFMEFIGEAWNCNYGKWEVDGKDIIAITGGWSGNEEIIGAFQETHLFWTLCWQESKRGGYHKFTIPEIKNE